MNLLVAYIEVLCGVLPLHVCHHQIHVKLWGQKLLESVPLLTVVAPDLEHCFQLWQLLCQSVIIENGKMQLYFWQWEMVLIYLNLSKVSFQVIWSQFELDYTRKIHLFGQRLLNKPTCPWFWWADCQPCWPSD